MIQTNKHSNIIKHQLIPEVVKLFCVLDINEIHIGAL
jgi:hypothetical protein